jgi:predicted PurR-regulated permease PerM
MGPSAPRARRAWWALGAVLGVLVVFVLYRFVGTFVVGVFLYYATRPIYRRVRRWLDAPASITAMFSLFLLVLPALAVGSYAVGIGIQEYEAVASSTDIDVFSQQIDRVEDIAATIQRPEQLLDDPAVVDSLRAALDTGIASLSFIGTLLLHLFIMLAIAFYLLRDDHRLSRWIGTSFADDRGVFEAYTAAVDRDLSTVFFGNILNAFLTGIIGAVTFSVYALLAPQGIGLPYPALLGLLAGVASLVPIVGMKLVYVPVGVSLVGRLLLAGATDLLWFPLGFFVVALVIVDTIPDLLIRPYISGRSLHVGLVMFAYIFGPLLFGWYGLFLGPLLLVVLVHFFRIVLPELLAGERIRPYAVDPGHLQTRLPEE